MSRTLQPKADIGGLHAGWLALERIDVCVRAEHGSRRSGEEQRSMHLPLVGCPVQCKAVRRPRQRDGGRGYWPSREVGLSRLLYGAGRRHAGADDAVRCVCNVAHRAPNVRSACPSRVLILSITRKHAEDGSARKPPADVDESARGRRPHTGQHMPFHPGSAGVRGSSPLSSTRTVLLEPLAEKMPASPNRPVLSVSGPFGLAGVLDFSMLGGQYRILNLSEFGEQGPQFVLH